MKLLINNNLLILVAGLISIAFVGCKTDKESESPTSDNNKIARVDNTGNTSRGFSAYGELSWKEIMKMDSLEKRQFYLNLTDSLPDLWTTMDVDATTYTIEDAIPLLPADEMIHLHYKQKVNGYRVWVDFIRQDYDLDIGRAILHFSKPEYSFQVYSDAFSDRQLNTDISYAKSIKHIDLSKIKPDDNVELDYINPLTGEFLSKDSPFYFKDMDFDGEKELVVNNFSMGSRGYNTYDVFKVFHVSKPLRLMGLPFCDDPYKMTNYNVEYEPEKQCVLDKRYDGADAYGHYRYKSIPSPKDGLGRVFILEDAEDMGFYHLKDKNASDSINQLQPYKKYERIHGKLVLTERGVYEQGNYGWNFYEIVLERKGIKQKMR